MPAVPVTLAPQRLVPVVGVGLLAAAVGALAGLDPVYGLAAALGVTFMLVLIVNLYAGLIIFILVISISEAPGFLGSDVTLTKVAGALLVVSWLLHLTLRRDAGEDFFPSRYPLATWTLAALLTWLAITQIWAADPASTNESLQRLFLSLILFLIAFTAVRTRQRAIGVIAALIAGACLDAVVGLVTPGNIANEARLAGGVSKPGELAAVLAAGLVLSLGLAAVLRPPLLRLCTYSAAGICLMGVLLTGSRAGLIALAIALAAFVLVSGGHRGRALMAGAVAVAVGFAFFNYAAAPSLRERVTTLGTGSGRVDLWTVGWRMVEDEPLRGVGYGNFPVVSARYVLEPGDVARGQYVVDDPKVAHNTYLELWAEGGIVALLLFAGIIIFCLWSTLRASGEFARQGERSMALLSRAAFVAAVAVLAGAFFASNQFQKDLWLVLALGPALLSISTGRSAGSATPALPRWINR